MIHLSQLLTEVETITNSYSRIQAVTGECFNIFSILGMETNEVKTHSRFIANLLDPKGSHCQGNIFMQKFLDYFGITDFDIESYAVTIEYLIGPISKNYESGGRIDILIHNKNEQAILIENKVEAKEQSKQLYRYNKAFSEEKIHKIFFLTLTGEESREESSKEVSYQPISYKEDMVSWLESCIRESASVPILRESLVQYLNLVKKITNQNPNKKMSQSIASRVLKDENSFEAFIALSKVKTEIHQNILNETVFPILEDIAKQFQITLYIDKSKWLNKSGEYLGFWYSIPNAKGLNLSIGFAFNEKKRTRGLIFGFSYIKPDLPKANNQYLPIKKAFNKIFDKSKVDSKYWLVWKPYFEYLDWEDLNNLKSIKFGNFKEDITNKVKVMLRIIKEVQSTISHTEDHKS